MEFAYLVLYLSLAVISLGLIFPAWISMDRSRAYDSPNFLWCAAAFTQFLSASFVAAYPFFGLATLRVGNTLQTLVDVLLVFLFRSIKSKVPTAYYVLSAFLVAGYLLIQIQEDYLHRNIASSVLLIGFSAWQIYELLGILKKSYSKYLLFICLAISVQVVVALLKLDLMAELLPTHGTALVPEDLFHESYEAAVERILVLLMYILILFGVGNYFFESVTLLADRQKKELEEQVTSVLTRLASARDNNTGKHLLRTQAMVRLLAEALRDSGRYADVLTDEKIRFIFLSSPLHDIGKVAISDDILLKPGALSVEERETVKEHAAIGEQILKSAVGTGSHPVLETAMKIAGSHHECWDGGGYPRGLRGQEIPLEGRIMAVVDVYDALTTRRSYKEPWPHEKAVELIRKGRATQFDPDVVDAFIAKESQFKAISQEMQDPDLGLDYSPSPR